MTGTTSVPKSVPCLVLDKVRLLLVSENNKKLVTLIIFLPKYNLYNLQVPCIHLESSLVPPVFYLKR